MPRPRPPHVHPQWTAQGKLVWYFRRGHGPRTRICAPGSPDFDAEYNAALSAVPKPPRTPKEAAGSLSWLIARYRETIAWMTLSAATKRQRENIFKHVIETAGDRPYLRITQADVIAGKERRSATPAQARNFLDAMRGLFRWALEAKHVRADPTGGVKNPPRKKGPGFIPWTEDHVDTYRKRWPLKTPQRVWMEVLLETGLRRGDAVAFGRQHIRIVTLPDGRTLKLGVIGTEKSQEEVPAIFPITAALEAIVETGPCGDLAFICGHRQQPLAKESFGNEFRRACKAAKVPGSAHGLRKLAAIRAAHRGATTAQLRALFAWVNDAMPALYTKDADRQRLAIQAALIFANDMRTSIPSLDNPVRDSGLKAQ